MGNREGVPCNDIVPVARGDDTVGTQSLSTTFAETNFPRKGVEPVVNYPKDGVTGELGSALPPPFPKGCAKLSLYFRVKV